MRRPRRRWGFTLVITHLDRKTIERDRPPFRFWTRGGALREADRVRTLVLATSPDPVAVEIEVERLGPMVTRPESVRPT